MSVVLLPHSIPWKKQPGSTTELSSHPVNQGILACYLFNEGTGDLRNLANGNLPGILTNGPAWGVSEFGRSLSFDGTDDYVNCGDVNTNASTVGNKITLLAWIKPTNLGSSGITSDVPIASKDDSLGASSQREWIWALEGSNGLVFRTIGGNNSPQPNVWITNEWQQAAIVWNVGTNVVTYRNGIEIATTALTDTSPNGTFRLEIGAWSTSSTPEFFEGEIGFFGVWQRGLSSQEILSLYENPYLGLSPRRRLVPMVIQGGVTVGLGLASELSSAFAISRLKQKAVGLSTETDSALATTPAKVTAVGFSTETDTAFSILRSKIKAAGFSTETDSALSLIISSAVNVGLSDETDSAFATSRLKQNPVGLSTETDAALSVGRSKIKIAGLGIETDVAFTISRSKIKALGLSSELDQALAISGAGSVAVGLASELDVALVIGRLKQQVVGQSAETDLAQSISRIKQRLVGLAPETNVALAVTIGGVTVIINTSAKETLKLLAENPTLTLSAENATLTLS